MSVIRVTNFGGLKPRAHARALPADAAQTAHNLQANTREFKPLANDTTVINNTGGANNPLTIFRLQRKADGTLNTNFADAAAWKIHAADISYAKMQVNDDTSDRHCYTFNDGSAPPRVVDATGDDRVLGVPAPAAKPTVTVNEVDEFTAEDRTAELQAALATAIQAVRDNVEEAWVGATHPGTGTTGYLDYDDAYGFAQDNPPMMLRAYRLDGAGGAVIDSYTAVDDTLFSWIFDPLLAGFPGATNGTPAWSGAAGTNHWLLPFHAYGQTYTLDTGGLTTALAAIAMPGLTDGTKLFTSDQVTEMVTQLNDYISPTGPALKPKLDALKAKVTEVKGLLDGGARSSMAAAIDDYYASKAATIAAIKASVADEVWSKAFLVAHSDLPPESVGAG